MFVPYLFERKTFCGITLLRKSRSWFYSILIIFCQQYIYIYKTLSSNFVISQEPWNYNRIYNRLLQIYYTDLLSICKTCHHKNRNLKISRYIAFQSYLRHVHIYHSCISFYIMLHHMHSVRRLSVDRYCILRDVLTDHRKFRRYSLSPRNSSYIFVFGRYWIPGGLSRVSRRIRTEKISARCMYLTQPALLRILLTNCLFPVLSSCLYNGRGKGKGTFYI